MYSNKLQKFVRTFGALTIRTFKQSSYLLPKKISTPTKYFAPIAILTPVSMIGFLANFQNNTVNNTINNRVNNTMKTEFFKTMSTVYELALAKDFEGSEKHLQNALELAKQMNSTDCLAHVYDTMGNIALRQNFFDKANKNYNSELEVLNSAGFKEDNIKVLQTRTKIAYVHQIQGNYEVLVREYKDIVEKILHQKETTELLGLLGFVKNQHGIAMLKAEEYAEAKKLFIDAYEAYSKAYGAKNLETIDVLQNFSKACQNCEDNTTELKFLEKAIKAAERVKDEAESAMLQAEVGLLYLKASMLKKARKSCEEALRYGARKADTKLMGKANECLDKIREIERRNG